LQPQIRLFTSKKTQENHPILEQPVIEEPWAVSSNISVDQPGAIVAPASGLGAGDDNWLYMSAVCWLYGREIARAKPETAIGLVNTNWVCF
jgi:sialate O-acetylesterase